MKRLVIILLTSLFIFVACNDKGLTLEEYRSLQEVVNIEISIHNLTEGVFKYKGNYDEIDVDRFNEFIYFIEEIDNNYKQLTKINKEDLGKEAKELHSLYLNYAYLDINSKKYYITSIKSYRDNIYAATDEIEKSNDLQDKALEYYDKILEFYEKHDINPF